MIMLWMYVVLVNVGIIMILNNCSNDYYEYFFRNNTSKIIVDKNIDFAL